MIPRLAASVLVWAILVASTSAQAVAGQAPAAVTPPADSAEQVPSWGGMFGAIGRDFLRLPSRESAAILGVAGGLSLALHSFDERVTRNAAASPALDHLFVAGAIGGGGLVQIGGALATYALGRGTGHSGVAITGAELVRAQIVAGVLTQGLKVSVGRRRPDGGRFSFPSGHTSATFATAAVLQSRAGWRLGVPAYAFGVYVAGSRLQDNRHYLSDVIFGAGLGIVSGRAVAVGRGRGAGVVQPVVTPNAVGLMFSLREPR